MVAMSFSVPLVLKIAQMDSCATHQQFVLGPTAALPKDTLFHQDDTLVLGSARRERHESGCELLLVGSA
jgi:hypothetical protein